MKFRSLFFNILIIGTLLLFLTTGIASAGKVQTQLSQESTVEKIIKRGSLRIGLSTFLPWVGKDKNGEMFGMEVDVAKRLAEDMGVKPEFIDTDFGGLIPALLTGKFDIIICGLSWTAERNLKVNFSDPYYYTKGVLYANKKAVAHFNPTKIEDFNRSDVIFSERVGITAIPFIKKYCPKAQIRLFKDSVPQVQEVRNGKAHASILDAPAPFTEVLDYPDLLYLPFGKEGVYEEPINFAVRKGDPDYLNYLNNWIRANRLNGFIEDRYDYYFTTYDWKSRVK